MIKLPITYAIPTLLHVIRFQRKKEKPNKEKRENGKNKLISHGKRV
jgi:hypothetical protein